MIQPSSNLEAETPRNRMILFPLSNLYGLIADFRNKLYEKGILKSHSLGARTISIGNITFGGTGKTPFVAFIADFLASIGEKVCVISRGYGRKNPRNRVLVSDGINILTDAETAGDEPFELAQKLLGKAVVVADSDRIEAAKWVLENFPVTVFVLDDAFQHIQAKRDLDIVLIDATKPFGPLREPLKNLERADLIVITRTNLVGNIEELKSRISEFTDAPIFSARNEISNLTEIRNFSSNSENKTANLLDSSRRTLAFCALGNPKNFFDQLLREKFDVKATVKFPDHYFYTQNDIENLERKARQSDAEILITTAKDAVKLKNLHFNFPCYVAESQMTFDDEKSLRDFFAAPRNS